MPARRARSTPRIRRRLPRGHGSLGAVRHRPRRSQSENRDGLWSAWLHSPPGRHRGLGRLPDRGADSEVGAAATEVPGHGLVDLVVGGVAVRRQQRGRGNHLTGLAVPALRDVKADPGVLDLLARRGLSDRFDRRDALALGDLHRGHTRADRLAVEVHGTGAASGDAAAELGAGEADHIAQYPEQRHIVRYVLGVRGTVDAHSGHPTLSRVGEGSSLAKLPQAPASRGQRGAYIIMQSHDAVRVAARERRCSGIVRWRGATCGIPSAIKMGMTWMMNSSIPLASRKDAMVPAAPTIHALSHHTCRYLLAIPAPAPRRQPARRRLAPRPPTNG